MQKAERPGVGVGVIIVREGRVLMGRRKGSHGHGSWSFPGGHLEFGESVEDCARREVLEETGVKIGTTRPGPYTNDIFESEHKHYVTVYVVADHHAGEAHLLEPGKCERWDWFEWGALPQPLFPPVQNLLRRGFHPLRP
ncbi:MAG TPA: NUDIX hydrolase [Terriglobales bacterium]|nr:NUDIX hydrolase [Terriglobales bacterium]